MLADGQENEIFDSSFASTLASDGNLRCRFARRISCRHTGCFWNLFFEEVLTDVECAVRLFDEVRSAHSHRIHCDYFWLRLARSADRLSLRRKNATLMGLKRRREHRSGPDHVATPAIVCTSPPMSACGSIAPALNITTRTSSPSSLIASNQLGLFPFLATACREGNANSFNLTGYSQV